MVKILLLFILGIPQLKITEEGDSGSLYVGYGDSRYFRIRTWRSRRRYKFISMIDFNILDIKGTFKRKGSEVGDWEEGLLSFND